MRLVYYLGSLIRVLSSAGERFLHTEEVAGPIPVALTIALFANLAHPVEQLICNQ